MRQFESAVSWDEFKTLISDHIKNKKGSRMCRGQTRSSWHLRTTFHRTGKQMTFPEYFERLRIVSDIIGTAEKRVIEIDDEFNRASFLAYLQHHGFPTPLLDWTLSPYIAAYFAFAGMPAGQTERTAIWIFDYMLWVNTWKQIRNFDITDSHVSVILPKLRGNSRQLVQQGFLYTFTNMDKVDVHLIESGREKGHSYLQKYTFDASERNYILNDLEAMGINSYSLFGSVDGLCKDLGDSIFRDRPSVIEAKSPYAEMLNALNSNVTTESQKSNK